MVQLMAAGNKSCWRKKWGGLQQWKAIHTSLSLVWYTLHEICLSSAVLTPGMVCGNHRSSALRLHLFLTALTLIVARVWLWEKEQILLKTGTYTIVLLVFNLVNTQNNAQTLCCVAYYSTFNQMRDRKFGMGPELFHSPFPYGDRKKNLFLHHGGGYINGISR